MGPSPLWAVPNEASLHRPLIPTQGQMQLSLSTWPSCPKRELQNKAVLTQGPGRDCYSLFPREEEGNGLTGCAAEELELAVQPCKARETWLPAWTRSCSASKAWLKPAMLHASLPGFRAKELMCLTNADSAVGPYNAPLLLWQVWGWTCHDEKLLAPFCPLLLSARGDVCPAGTALILEHNCNVKGGWKGGWS